MNWKVLRVILCMFALIVVSGGNCGDVAPETPGAPDGPGSAYQREPAAFDVTTTQANEKDILYVMDWGDGVTDTTTASFASGAVAKVTHPYPDTGQYSVKAMALLASNTDLASDWSEAASITILPNAAPDTILLQAPLAAVVDVEAFFTVAATDPDGDSVGYKFDWGDGKESGWTDEDTAVGFAPSGRDVEYSHTYTAIETVWVKCKARDIHKSESDWSDSAMVVVGEAGAVIWYWFDYDPIEEDEWYAITSACIAFDEEDEYIYTTTDGSGIFGVSTSGRRRRSGGPVLPSEENEFTGHPAYCAATQHIICGNEDGELYAFKTSLSKEWHWPGNNNEEELTYIPWGTAAINGNKIYVPSDNDSLYYFTDMGADAVHNGSYYIPGMVEAPVIDASGNVYIGTETGYLYKLTGSLGLVWKKLIEANSEIYSPAIGSDGTIYCGTGMGKLVAVNPATGVAKWEKQISQQEVYHIAVSPTSVIAGTGSGYLFCLEPATGTIKWYVREDAYVAEITANPILAGDLVYYQDDDDVVWCRRQSDGVLLWSCDCTIYAPTRKAGHGRRGKLIDDIRPQPGMLSDGNVVIVGEDAVYCVAGYEDKKLQTTAPWPKWQKNSHNTGKAGSW